jgi:hypothetical protein
LFTTKISHKLFKPKGVKNNYGQPQGPTVQFLGKHSSNTNRDDNDVSSSHAYVPLNDAMFVKLVVDNEVKAKEACMDKGKTDVKPKSMTSHKNQTLDKFVPTCHHCGIGGQIRSSLSQEQPTGS